jgi:formate dehydrogenase major subunit
MEGIGSAAVTAPFTAAADAEVIIIIWARPTENHPVAATFFKQAAKRGAKLFVMDPRGQAMARYATRMLRFKPGRDVAMLNAMLHTIVEEGLYDRQYVEAHTQDFAALREHVRDYAPERMAEICGIDAAILREVGTNVQGGIITGSGHWVMEEQPAQTVSTVRAFLYGK